MARAALFIGIDNYTNSPLSGCEADAQALSGLLSRNADESLNFQCSVMVSSEQTITKSAVNESIQTVFSNRDADVALFYFAGHGALTQNGGYLVTQDATKFDEGIPMAQLITAANASPSQERVIILDCCHAGIIDELFGSGANIPLAQGVSILAACRKDQGAAENNGRGLFTSLVCSALDGGAADIRGSITIPSLYSYVDEILTIFDQRPLLKANVSKLIPIRKSVPAVPDNKLRLLIKYFPQEGYVHALDPSYEPAADPAHAANEAIFADLQTFRGARLVVPVGANHLYDAAMQSKGCELTPHGRFYWRCVKAGKI